MSTIDELIVQIDASTELLRRELARGTDAVNDFADKSGKSVFEFGGRLTTLTEIARGAREAFELLGVGFGVHAFASWIEDATKINKLTDEQAEKIGGAKQALSEVGEAVDDLARSFATKLAPAIERAAKTWREFLFPTGGEAADARIAQINSELDVLNKQAEQLAEQRGGAADNFFTKLLGTDPTAELKKVIDQIRTLQAERAKLISTPDAEKEKDTTLDQYRLELASIKEVAEARKAMDAEAVDQYNNELDLQRELAEEAKGQLEEITVNATKLGKALPAFDPYFTKAKKSAEDFADSFGRGLHNALVDFIVDGQAKFGDFLKRLAAELAVSGIFDLISGGLAGSTGPVGQFFSKAFAGRAGGGPVSAGTPYIVGENGPELFLPSGAGTIVPNGAGPGGITVNLGGIHVTADEPALETRLLQGARLAASATYDMVMDTLKGIR